MSNLNQLWNERKNKISEIEKDIEHLNKLLRAKKDEWCLGYDEYNAVNHYKVAAKSMNHSKRFGWVLSESNRWTSKGTVKTDKWRYDGIEYEFEVYIVHRDDLKVWKYEVHVEVKELINNKAYYPDYSYNNQTGNMYSKVVKGYGDDVVTKFKTEGEALGKVYEWQTLFEERYKEKLDYAKDMYEQACKKYDDMIRIATDWDNRKAFRDIIRFYPEVKIVEDDRDYIELTGNNVKEVITELNEKYKLKLEVLAG